MPPFSGKKKKEQLQAKRQKKREKDDLQREREKAYETALEEAIRDGVSIEEFENEYRISQEAEQKGRRKGRRQHKKGNQNDDSDSANDEGDEKEYIYGADRKGVRSAFVKEKDTTVHKRKALNYEPLQHRYFMNQNGIPFGSWLVAPGYGNMERVSRSHNNSFRRGGNETANNENNNTNNSSFPSPPELPKEEEDFMDRSKVEKPETDKNSVLGAASTTFPFSIELPSRGWKMDAAAASQGRVGAVEEGNLNHLITCTNETVFDLEAITEEEISSDASENPNKDNKTHSGSPFSETIQQIERERFQRYLDYVEHFPIEKYTDGGESDGGVSPLPQPLMDPRLTVNSYERNLEVWRQLWRAVEQSDVALLVADSRFPIVHLPLAVLHYITVEERKPLIIVLNKSDLVPSFVVRNWIGFLRRFLKYYGLHIMTREAEEAYLTGEQTSEAGDSSSLGAPIIIRTFTADPFGLTAIEEKGGQLDVQRRRRKNKKRRAKIYELLRSGKVSAHQGPSNHGDDTNNFYRANFKGMKKANQALNSEENELKEIQAVSKSIDELLQISKRLAKLFYGDKKVFQEKEKSPVEEQTEKHVDVAQPPPSSSDEDDSSSSDDDERRSGITSNRSTPIIAPRHKRDKGANKKRNKKKQRNNNSHPPSEEESDMSSIHLSDSDEDHKGRYRDSEDEVFDERQEDSEAYVHLAVVGFPNVGKSSLLNCIRGTKVVSVSQTAGHTKHVQTIPMPEDGITLIDSPGLAFPLLGLPPPLQAVIGTHQIAQVRDPMSGVAYLASHLPLERIYHLRPVDSTADDPKYPWSGYELCESFAKKKGFYSKNGKGTLDVHRAAIAILKEAYEGRLVLYYSPPERNFLESRHFTALYDKLFLRVFKSQ